MNPHPVDELYARVERLERVGRRADRALIAAAVVIGLTAALGSARKDDNAEVIEAESFELQDGEGREKAQLGLTLDDKPGLDFFNDKRDSRLSLAVFQGAMPIIMFMGKDDDAKMSLRIGIEGLPAITLDNNNNDIGLFATVSNEGDSNLCLSKKGAGMMLLSSTEDFIDWGVQNGEGKVRTDFVSYESKGLTSLNLRGPNGASRMMWVVSAGGLSSLSLLDRNGGPLFEIPGAAAEKRRTALGTR